MLLTTQFTVIYRILICDVLAETKKYVDYSMEFIYLFIYLLVYLLTYFFVGMYDCLI